MELDRTAGVDAPGVVGVQTTLDVVESGSRLFRVVLVRRGERSLGGAPAEQLLPNGGHGPERLPAGLEGQRHGDVGPAAVPDRVEGVQLERREVVEAVDEQRRDAPGLGVSPQGVERAPARQLHVHEPRFLEPGAVAAVDGGHLLRVGPPRAVARPVPERAREAGGIDHRAPKLGDEARGGADEPGPFCGAGEDDEPRPLDRVLDDQLALQWRCHALAVAGPRGDLPEQPLDAQDARAEHRAALGQLALGVLHVAEGGNEQDRLVVEACAQAAEHFARLGCVRGARYESERHP